jgi:hypothetical protein
MSHWSVTWTACWSGITPARITAIETYLQEKIENLDGSEINEAVEGLAQNWNTKEMGAAPGIGLLINTIRQARKRKAGIDTSEPYDVAVARKRVIGMTSRGLDRWNAICEYAVTLGSLHAIRICKACLPYGGLTVPWWINPQAHGIPCTHQEVKPQGVKSWVDCIK